MLITLEAPNQNHQWLATLLDESRKVVCIMEHKEKLKSLALINDAAFEKLKENRKWKFRNQVRRIYHLENKFLFPYIFKSQKQIY
jgi:hypothetical protein